MRTPWPFIYHEDYKKILNSQYKTAFEPIDRYMQLP